MLRCCCWSGVPTHQLSWSWFRLSCFRLEDMSESQWTCFTSSNSIWSFSLKWFLQNEKAAVHISACHHTVDRINGEGTKCVMRFPASRRPQNNFTVKLGMWYFIFFWVGTQSYLSDEEKSTPLIGPAVIVARWLKSWLYPAVHQITPELGARSHHHLELWEPQGAADPVTWPHALWLL